MDNVIIIGSGPAAHTAAIYTGRAELKPRLFEGFMAAGIAAGGQLTTTTDIENFPGFPEGINGQELMLRMRQQSVHCGATIETKTVTRVDLQKNPFQIFADQTMYESAAVIIATGATAKRLDIKGQDKLWQKGISACAVCDGALPIFRGKKLFVIGGGDTAAEEALYLTKFASRVYMVVRRDVLRASRAMQNRVLNNDRIEMLWRSNIIEAIGETQLTHLKIKNNQTQQEQTLEASGLFFAIGHQPNTDFIGNQLELDENGYIRTQPGNTKTNLPGVFACGDVQDHVYRQAITASGTGCQAALEAERYLSERNEQ